MRSLILLLLLPIACLSGCAMSMPAEQFYAEFPAATQSRYLTGADATFAILEGACIELDEHRYLVPVGYTVGEELRNGAEGVDVIIANDGGNAYKISNYAWVHLASGATQLQIDFHTLHCNFTQQLDVEQTTTET